MAQQTINVGASPNDGTGTPLRTAFQYTNSNFSELYTAVGPSGNNIVVPGNATITGDLTVKTNVLKVDTTNNWVGVGTATPAVRLHSSVADAAEAARFSASTAILRVFPYVDATDKTKIQAANSTITGLSDLTVEGLNLRFNTNVGLAYAISNTGVATWSNVGGVAGTAMILNATGLGIGTTVLGGNKLAIGSTSDTSATTNAINIVTNRATITTTCNGAVDAAGTTINYSWANGGQGPLIFRNASVSNVMTLDASGNVGIGVAPSAKLHVEGGGAQARFSIASASDARHEYYRNGIREGLLYWDANLVGLYATQSSGELVLASSNTIRVRVKSSGQVRFVPLASDPAGAEAGDVYYNSTSNKLKCYNGTTWNDLF